MSSGRPSRWKRFSDWADRLDYAFAHQYDIVHDGPSEDLMAAMADDPDTRATWDQLDDFHRNAVTGFVQSSRLRRTRRRRARLVASVAAHGPEAVAKWVAEGAAIARASAPGVRTISRM